ncbi:hypothetical protein D3C71_1389200 [compost metagenome]
MRRCSRYLCGVIAASVSGKRFSPAAKIGSSTVPPVALAASWALALPGLMPWVSSRWRSSSAAITTGLSGKRPCSALATAGRLPGSNAATVAKPSDCDRLLAVA